MTTADTALSLLASLTDHVGRWWTTATDLQRADARAILDLDGPRRHWLGRAKGYSKTRDVAGMSIVAMLTQMAPGDMGYAAAADAEQAGLLRQSVAAFKTHTPALEREITVESRRVVAERRGVELVILPADTAGSHGLRPKWLVGDEVANWPDTERHQAFFDSLWAGLPKVPDSRGIIITTASSPGHWARRIFELAGDDPLWRLSDVQGPPPWTDPAEVAAERRRLFPSQFARLWMNEWAAATDAIADPADVRAACVLSGPLPPEPGQRYVCTLDVGTRNDRTAVAIAHAVQEADGTRVVVDRLEVWTPKPGLPVSLDEVRLFVTEMCRAYHCRLVYDPSQAYLMAEQIRRSQVAAEEFIFSSSSVGRLGTAMMQALRGRLLTLPADEALRDEILNVRMRETSPNVLRIDHRSGGHDDRVIAVAMAVYVLTSTLGTMGRPVLYTDEELKAFRLAQVRSELKAPEPAPEGFLYSGDTSTGHGLEPNPNQGRTARSPFA